MSCIDCLLVLCLAAMISLMPVVLLLFVNLYEWLAMRWRKRDPLEEAIALILTE